MEREQLHHQELVAGISKQMKSILDSSQQAVYIYLDDIHKVCNSKFATLLGYRSPEEWVKVEDAFEVFVDQSSQETLASAYHRAMGKINPCEHQSHLKKEGRRYC